MVQRRCCALVVGACLLYRPLVQLQHRYQQHLAFVIAPASRDSLRVAQGPGTVPLTGVRVQPQLASFGAGISQIVFVATVSLAACLAFKRPVRRRNWSLISCAGKKRGGGGRGGGGAAAPESGEDEPQVDTEAVIKEFADKMGNSVEVLRTNLSTIRAGRATPALLDGIKVNAYETEVAINEVGTVNVSDTTTLTITCFDESTAPAVEKAIMSASLGYSVQSNGPTLKVGIPPLTTDKRKEYAKLAKDFTEKSRVAVRNVRQAALKKVKGLSKSLSEDIVKSMQSEIESVAKKSVAECDKVLKAKETELMNG